MTSSKNCKNRLMIFWWNLQFEEWKIRYTLWKSQIREQSSLIKFDLGRDMPLTLNFYTKFCGKMRPIFIPEPQIFNKSTENFTLFSKIVKLSSKFWKFWYQIDEIGPIFTQNFITSWKYNPFLYLFLHLIRGYRYTRRLILGPIPAARPRIDLCTKNPPPRSLIKLRNACHRVTVITKALLYLHDQGMY